jgi:hypothetical protein
VWVARLPPWRAYLGLDKRLVPSPKLPSLFVVVEGSYWIIAIF